MKIRGSLSYTEIETFLDEVTIPVRLACQTPSGHLWMVALWYRTVSDDGDATDRSDWVLQCATGATADVVSYLRETPDVAFEISTNEPPYRGVRGRGTASIEPDDGKATLRDLLDRYLGGTDSKLAVTLLDDGRDEVTITIDPAVVYGWDYSDRM